MQRTGKIITVMKFGGTSVACAKRWDAIASVAKERLSSGAKPFIVCSALAGISDLLHRLTSEARFGRHQETLDEIVGRHDAIASELGVERSTVDVEIDELKRLATGISLVGEASPKIIARVMSLGEILSTKLGCAYLKKSGLSAQWIDARKFIISSEVHPDGDPRKYLAARAFPEFDASLSDIASDAKHDLTITQGFIGSNPSGETILLGRGGSDVSAAHFAAKLGAARCEIWTDVPGMYTANPHVVPSARLLQHLDYDEAQEIASLGAKVLHPRTIAPMKKSRIPIHIYSTLNMGKDGGTLISQEASRVDAGIKAISTRRNITLVSMETIEMLHQVGFLASIFECFRKHGISIDLISTSETNVTVTIDNAENSEMKGEKLLSLLKDLKLYCQPKIVDSCGSISLIGRNVRSILHKISGALEAFEEEKIYMLSQAANDLNITFVVDSDMVDRLAIKLHNELFQIDRIEPYLGPAWSRPEESAKRAEPWWMKKREEIISLAEKNSPLYLYDRETISGKIAALKSMSACDRVFYSVKANPSMELLKMIESAGLGFECVSIDEVNHVIENFSGIDRERILFTPNFVEKSEYASAVKAGVKVTVDNLYPLLQWPEIFKGADICARIDPGQGLGHHKYVHTGGAKSKFGIVEEDIEILKSSAKKAGAKIVALHAHSGSNIFKPDAWSTVYIFLAELAQNFPDVRAIDVGGRSRRRRKTGAATARHSGYKCGVCEGEGGISKSRTLDRAGKIFDRRGRNTGYQSYAGEAEKGFLLHRRQRRNERAHPPCPLRRIPRDMQHIAPRRRKRDSEHSRPNLRIGGFSRPREDYHKT